MKSLIPVVLLTLTLFGLVADHEFFRNISLGLVWLSAVSGLIIVPFIMSDNLGAEVRKTIKEKPAWRKWMSRGGDATVVILLAGHGYWLTFAVFATEALLSGAAELHAEKHGDKEKDPA